MNYACWLSKLATFGLIAVDCLLVVASLNYVQNMDAPTSKISSVKQ
jgi:hypothetical protein